MKAAALLAVMALAACSCAERPAPAPRPEALPRPALYDAAYRRAPLPGTAGDSLTVNASAVLSAADGPGWFNIAYPAYGITLNCTLTREGNLHAVLANRAERMARNVEGVEADVAQWPGAVMLVAPRALRTPVQFLATDSASWVLSGVAVGAFAPSASADSVVPLVNAVAADVARMLADAPETLKSQKI